MLDKVERITVDRVVADSLKKWIIEKDLKPGTKLPSEQQLSEELGVARHTLREGIKLLTQLGIVFSRVGSGIYIGDVSFENVSEYLLYLMQRQYISCQDIYRVRYSLECSVAHDAALNIDDAQIAVLNDRIAQLDACLFDSNFESYVLQDIAFHIDLAVATRNHLFIGLIQALQKVYFEHMTTFSATTITNSQQQHRAIAAAVSSHNPDLAEELMKCHMKFIYENRDF